MNKRIRQKVARYSALPSHVPRTAYLPSRHPENERRGSRHYRRSAVAMRHPDATVRMQGRAYRECYEKFHVVDWQHRYYRPSRVRGGEEMARIPILTPSQRVLRHVPYAGQPQHAEPGQRRLEPHAAGSRRTADGGSAVMSEMDKLRRDHKRRMNGWTPTPWGTLEPPEQRRWRMLHEWLWTLPITIIYDHEGNIIAPFVAHRPQL